MPPVALMRQMEQLALQPDFQAINDALIHLSKSGNRVVCSIRFDFEWKGGILKPGAIEDTYGYLRRYKQHFHAMPEDPTMIEAIAWELLHTEYWQAYYAYYGRPLPTRAEFHHKYFEKLPGKKVKGKAGKPDKLYVVIPGEVYIIDADGSGRYKIGRGESALIRKDGLETSSPFPLRILRIIKTNDAAGLERLLHTRYHVYNVHKEWFKLPAEVLAALLTEAFV